MSCLNREAFTLATGQGTRTAMSDNRLGGEAIVVPNANKDIGGGITVNRKGGSRSKGRGGSNSRVNGDATDGLNTKRCKGGVTIGPNYNRLSIMLYVDGRRGGAGIGIFATSVRGDKLIAGIAVASMGDTHIHQA